MLSLNSSNSTLAPPKAVYLGGRAPAATSVARPVLAASSIREKNGHDNAYYAKCMVGGILSCGLTHASIVSLDLVKCRMQVGGARAPVSQRAVFPAPRTR